MGLVEREQVVALLLCNLVLLRTGSLLCSGSLVGAQALDHSVLRLTINFLSRLLLGLRLLIGGLVLPRRSVFAFLLLLSRRILVFFLLVIRGGFALISLLVVGILVLAALAAAGVALLRTAVAATLAAFPAFVVARGSVSAPEAALILGTAHILALLLLFTIVSRTIFSAGTLGLLAAASGLLLLVVHGALDVGGSHRGLHRGSDMLDAIIIFLLVALNFEPLALHHLGRFVVCVHHSPVRTSLRHWLYRDLGHLAGPGVGELGRATAGRVLLVQLLEELLIISLMALAMLVTLLAALALALEVLPLLVSMDLGRLRLS